MDKPNTPLLSEKISSTLDYFTIIKTLGKGSSAKVKLVQDPYSKSFFAAKIIKFIPKYSPFYYRSKIAKEVKLISKLSHPGVLKLYNYSEAGSYISKSKGFYSCMYVLFSYCPNGDLFDLLTKTGPLPEALAKYFFSQIFEILKFIHSKGVVHGDLKPENLLIDSDFKIKLADFELAFYGETKSYVGTERYLPPEARLENETSNYKSDYFVLGMILFILHVGCPPFTKSSEEDPLFFLLKNRNEQFWKYFKKHRQGVDFSKGFREIVEGLLNSDVNKRWASEEVEKSEYFKESFDLKEVSDLIISLI